MARGKCGIVFPTEQDFQKAQIKLQANGMKGRAGIFGNPETLNKEASLEDIGKHILVLNSDDNLTSSVKKGSRNYTRINRFNYDITTPSNKKKLNDPYATKDDDNIMSIAQKRSRMTGSLYDDVVLSDAFEFVLKKLTSTSGNHMKKNPDTGGFQMAFLDKDVLEKLDTDSSFFQDLFGVDLVTDISEVIPGSLLNYMISQAKAGKYKISEKINTPVGEREIVVNFSEDALQDTAVYISKIFKESISYFRKRSNNYIDNTSVTHDVYSDMIVAIQPLVFSTERNQGGFIDMVFISRNGNEGLVIDHKTKVMDASEVKSTAIVSPLTPANEMSHSDQLHVYMDGLRFLGVKPVMGMLMPSTFIVPAETNDFTQNKPIAYKVIKHFHEHNANNDNFSNIVITYSSALVKSLDESTTSLSDVIDEFIKKSKETRMISKSSIITKDDDARNDIWDKIQEQHFILQDLYKQLSANHKDAFRALTRNHDMSLYLKTAVHLQDKIKQWTDKSNSLIYQIITHYEENKNTNRLDYDFFNEILDEFMLIQNQSEIFTTEINGLQNIFNFRESKEYIDSLMKYLSIGENATSNVALAQNLLENIDNILIEAKIPFGFNQINHIKILLNKYIEASKKQLTSEKLKDILYQTTGFTDSNEYLNLPLFLEEVFRKHIQFIESSSQEIKQVNNNMILQLIPKTYKQTESNLEGSVVVVPELSYNDRWFSRPELINNPLFEIMISIKNRNNQRGQRLFEQRIRKFTEIHNNFNKYSETNGLGYDKTVDLILDRKKTGQLHSKYTKEFDKAIKNALSFNDIVWMKKYHRIKDMNTLNEEYEIRLKNYKNSLNFQIQSNLITEEQAENRLENFKLSNDLFYKVDSGLNTFWINRYNLRYMEPNRKANEDFASEEYKKIESIPQVLAMYEEFISLTQEAKNLYGSSGAVFIPDNFFPNFIGELSEQLLNPGNLQSFGHMMDIYTDALRISPIDDQLGVQDDRFGRSSVPFYGIAPLVDHEGNIYSYQNEDALERNANKKSYDLAKVANLFIASMYTFAQYQYTEPIVDSLLNFAKSNSYVETRSNRGVRAKTPVGNPRTTANENSKKPSAELLESYLYYFWYGIRYKDLKKGTAFDKILFKGNLDKGKGPITFQSTLFWLKSMYSRNVLGLGFVTGTAAGTAGLASLFINSIEDKYIDPKSFKKATKLFFGSVANGVKASQIMQRAIYFDAGSMSYSNHYAMKGAKLKNKALSDYMLYAPLRKADIAIGQIITEAVLNSWGLMPTYDESGNLIQDRNLWNIARLQDIPEAHRKPLIEYFSYDNDNNQIVDKAIGEKQVSQIYNVITQLTTDTYGQLPENTKMGAQLTILGTLLTTFSTWMPAIVNKRIGKTKVVDFGTPEGNFITSGRYNSVLHLLTANRLQVDENGELKIDPETTAEDYKKGVGQVIGNILLNIGDLARYMLFFGAFSSNASDNLRRLKTVYMRWAMDNPQEVEKLGRPKNMTLEELDEWRFQKWLKNEIANLKAAAVELYVITGLMLLLAAARADWDNDEEPDYKKLWALRMFVKTMNKTHSELIFLLNPVEIERYVTQPIPIAGLLKDVLNSVENAYDETRDWLSGENSNNDKTPWMYYTGNLLIPGFRQMRRIFEPFEQDEISGTN